MPRSIREAPRYLDFERWWGGHVNLNADEIQFIVDQLFVGNNLAAGKIQTADGTALDLRNIRSPIVVFCSEGDNITPPPQALGWLLDVYDSVEDIRSHGQTIVYSVHQKIGHLGIFVSGGVARKEHSEFSSNIDLIDLLPPGLYEATFERKGADTANPDLASGDWVMRCEQRSLDDIRALGGNDSGRRSLLCGCRRISELNLAAYRTYAQPFVRALATAPMGEWMQKLHPLRITYELFSDANPMMAMLKPMTNWVGSHRRPAAQDNPFVAWQETVSKQIVSTLDAWRDARDNMAEQAFFAVYGSPQLQPAVGIDPTSSQPLRRPAKDPLHQELLGVRIADLKSRIPVGGLREALIRALLYVGMARGAVDERGFESVRRIRREQDQMPALPLAAFKALVREQFYMLLIDQDAALAAIPAMLPDDVEGRRRGIRPPQARLERELAMSTPKARSRLARIARLFELKEQSESCRGCGGDAVSPQAATGRRRPGQAAG